MQAIEVDAGGRFREIGSGVVAEAPPPDAAVLLGHVAAGTAWVAVDDGAHPGGQAGPPVGYAVASVVDGEGHLDQVSVRERAQGRGIGRSLLAAVVAWSRAAGHTAVTLTTYRDVPWNGPWYGRMGFVEIPEDALTPGLHEILVAERAQGLEPPARIAMRRGRRFGPIP